MVTMRRGTPTWIAARPMPGASFVHEAQQFVVDALDRLADEPQLRVRQGDDVEKSHENLGLSRFR
jgi:hypothetical protein